MQLHHHDGGPEQLHAERALVTIATVHGAERARLTRLVPIDAFTDPLCAAYWTRLSNCHHIHLTACPHHTPIDIADHIEREHNACGAILLADETDAIYDYPKHARQLLRNHNITLAERAHIQRLADGHDPTDSSELLQRDLEHTP